MKHPLRSLLSALDIFRVAGGRDHPIQLLIAFLYVAEHNGCLQSELIKAVGTSEASVSRTLDWLGDTHRSGRPGLELVRREVDPTYWKRYKLFLTEKGQRLAALIAQSLGDLDD